MTYHSDPTPITSAPIRPGAPIDLVQAVRDTFGRWLEGTGRTLEQGPETITEKIVLTKTPRVDERSGYDYISEKITPTLHLHNLVIDGEHYPEVHLPCTLHQLLTAAADRAEIMGKPADADQFPPAPRSRQQIIKDAGLEENTDQLQALQTLYTELGGKGLAKAAETISNLSTQERTRFLNTNPTD